MFIIIFYALCVICALLFCYASWTSRNVSDDASLKQLRTRYLLIYLAAAAGDWLHVVHVIPFYNSILVARHHKELLFVVGFLSSLIFGTFIGSFGDKYGRRRNCILYGVLYGGVCITNHFEELRILMLGRLFVGIATSILYTSFESWLVFEHAKHGFNEDALSTVFSFATLGYSLMGIGSSVVAQYATDMFDFVAPFDISLTVLLVTCFLIYATWTENFGDATAPLYQSFAFALRCLREDRRILYLGLVQSFFESSMFVFVLKWTPALKYATSDKSLFPNTKITANPSAGSSDTDIPQGYIFATFMIAIMIGSSLFRILYKFMRPESFMRWVVLMSVLALLPSAVIPTNLPAVYAGFIVFEICVGLFWPSMGFMRAIYVPETARSTLMNIFRVPLNLIVVGLLFPGTHNRMGAEIDSMQGLFQYCVILMAIACLFQQILFRQIQAYSHIKLASPSGTCHQTA